MTFHPLRVLFPTPPAQGDSVEQTTGGGSLLSPPPPVPAARSEHERLTAGTADLWRQLVHLCWETP